MNPDDDAFRNTAEWKLGRKGEQIVAGVLRREGWRISEKSLFSGEGAPVLDGIEGFLVMPDLDILKRGERRWVEVKTKTDRVYFHKWKRYVHGISCYHFAQYKMIEKESGTPCYLFIYEVIRNNVLTAPMNRLTQGWAHREYHGENEQDKGGNVYFDLGAFDLFAIPDGPTGEMWSLQTNTWRLNRG